MDKQRIFECGIIPVIKLYDARDAAPLCKALYEGGIDVAEITFRTDAAAESIRQATEALPQVLIGAGTVLDVKTCKTAVASGAKFIVTPGFNPSVVRYCRDNDIPVFPGVTCPTDIDAAREFGLDTLKFFPAEAYGGLKTLKALTAPYPMVKFIPTGGIDAANLPEYAAFDKVLAVGGSFMVKDDLIKAGRFDEITALSRNAVKALHSFRFVHMAINQADESKANATADLFAAAFGLPKHEFPNSFFIANEIEILKAAGPGENGHIAIKCNNVARAVAYLKRLGIEVDPSTFRGPEGSPVFAYLKQSFGGFAVHLIQ